MPRARLVPHAERLATANPDNATYLHRLGWIHVVHAQRLDRAGRRPEAEAPARAALDVFARVTPAWPDNLTHDAVVQVGTVSGYLPPADAVAPVEHAVTLARSLADRAPGNRDYAERTVWILTVYAAKLTEVGQVAGAEEFKSEAAVRRHLPLAGYSTGSNGSCRQGSRTQ